MGSAGTAAGARSYNRWMTALFRDSITAARTLLKARAFTAVCVTSLGLGMAVVIGMLLLMRMLLGAPPGVNEDGLVELVIRPSGALRAQAGGDVIDTWSYADYLDLRTAVRGVAITGWSRGDGLFRPPDRIAALPLAAVYVSSNYFQTLAVTLPLGRGFTRADDGGDAEPEAVISHRVWEIQFGSDPNIIGRTVTINQTGHTIVGVAPKSFRGHVTGLNEAHYQLWLPLTRHPRLTATATARLDRESGWVHVAGRLAPATTVAQADATVQAAVAAMPAASAVLKRERTGGVERYFPPGARLRSAARLVRATLFGLSGLVLLVVGLNISGMMLARGAIRERELAVRTALGASRRRLVQYHLVEAFVLALCGGAFASALLFAGPIVLASAFDMFGPALDIFRPDLWIALQCVALCFVTSLVLGLLPAIRFSRPSIVDALKNDSSGAGRRVGRLQRFTVAAQAAIAVPLLVISGLQLDQARVTALTDVGFSPAGLYAARLNLGAATKTEDERRVFLRTVQESLAQAPGVQSVSVGDGMPLDFIYRNARVARSGESTFTTAHTTRIAPGYLDTLETKLLAGRAIDANDGEAAERVVMLSAPLARDLFPGQDPIGQRIDLARGVDERRRYTVIGITADLVSTQMGNPRPQLFLSLAQEPATSVMVIVRGHPADPSIRGAFNDAIASGLRMATSAPADPDVVFRELITGEGQIDNSRRDLLTSAAVGGGAAAVAMVLAALGVYGVIAFMVATRTREIGVRVALGASRARILRDVLGDTLRLVVPGIAIGVLLAVLWVRLADPSWYPLGGVEPLVYSMAAATAFAVALLAGIPSARRAARVHPVEAMRAE
jgi:predicted permease